MPRSKALFTFLLPLLLAACGSSPSWDGYSPAEAGKLQAMGINAREATEYREMGFNSNTVQQWYDAGITEQQHIVVWHDGLFSASEAGAWNAAGFLPVDAYKWRKENFSAAEAKSWSDAGSSLRDATKKRKKGMRPGQAN